MKNLSWTALASVAFMVISCIALIGGAVKDDITLNVAAIAPAIIAVAWAMLALRDR